MDIKNTKRYLAAFIIMMFAACLGEATVSAKSMSRVFILHSYEKDDVCGKPQNDGILAALKHAGFTENNNLDVQFYYMDTKRKNNTSVLIEKQASAALEKIRKFKPDILVTLDDNAFRSVALKLVDSGIPIVFSGMNGQPEIYNQQKLFMNSRANPGHNITGVYEKLHIAEAIRVHSRLFPDLKKVLIITDQSPTGRAINIQIKLELSDESTSIGWEMKVVKSWDEYKSEIISANDNPEIGAIYPVALLLKDKNGNTYTAPQILKWTTQVSKKPELALNYAFLKMGLFGGAAVDFYVMGEQAGKMAVRILKGENTGNISIEDASRSALAFNLKRARQLQITIPDDILLASDEVIK